MKDYNNNQNNIYNKVSNKSKKKNWNNCNQLINFLKKSEKNCEGGISFCLNNDMILYFYSDICCLTNKQTNKQTNKKLLAF